MSIQETHAFPVTVEWFGGRLTRGRMPSGESLEIAASPAFGDGLEGFWSPEDLLVASVGSCFVLGLTAACEARSLPLHEVRVKGRGFVGERVDGRYGVQSIELELTVEAPTERLDELARVVRHVERYCVVSTALAVPVHYEFDVRASDARAATA
jgi:organic hydroperoxide reductase OsmC/OhrA